MATALRASRRILLLGRRSPLVATTPPGVAAVVTAIRSASSSIVLLDPPKHGVVAQNYNHNVLFRRSMVMVTKQKAGETFAPPTAAAATNTSDGSKKPAAAAADTAEHHPNDRALTVTESCWKRIRKLAESKQDDSLFLRVFVDAGGCSGFQYQFELDSALQDDDVVFLADNKNSENDTARVVVDQQSLNLIRGSTIDYVQEMIKSSFEVRNNPQSESACGCGSSFAVKNFASNPALD